MEERVSEPKEYFGAGLPPGFVPLPPKGEAPREESARPPGFQEVKPPWKGDKYSDEASESRGILPGAIMDTLGLTDRPGADTPVRVVTKPETFAESLIPAAIAAPLIYAGGAGAGAMGVPALAGRIATSGAIGAGQSAARGDDLSKMGLAGLLDAAVSGLTEGVGGAATKAVGKLAGPARAFEYATEAPSKALDFLRARLPAGKWINAPSIDSAKMTVDEAVKKLSTMSGKAYEVARKELASELSRLDAQSVTGPKPLAGQVFKDQTSKQRFQPPSLSSIADKVAGALKNPEVRAAMDSLMIAPFPGARAPLGAVAGAALAGSPLVKHIPGAKKVSEVVEEAE